MAQMTPVVNSFNAGEFSPLLEGRFDLQKYGSACRTLENFLIQPYGGVTKRPGTRFVAATKYAAKKARLVKFEYSADQAYHLEFGDEYIRFVQNGGQVVKDSPAAWLTGTVYAVGDFVEEAGDTYYCIEAHTAGTFATDLAADKWVEQSVYEIPTPYLEADLPQLRFARSADVMFIVHPDYAPRQLSRFAHDNWTLEPVEFVGGPFLDENTGATTITPSYPAWVTATDYEIGDHVEVSNLAYVAITDHTSGAGNPTPPGNTTDWRQIYQFDGDDLVLTASANLFDAKHVGSLWRIRHQREAMAVEASFSAATQSSAPFQVFGSWRFVTRGTWTATVEIQRSYDNGATWLTFQVYTGANDFNTNTTGEEIERGVLYRITRTVAGSGTLGWMFNINQQYYDGTVKITAVNSATEAVATVEQPVGSLDATDLWSEGAWSEYRGYPAIVAFFEQRLFFANTVTQPQTIWGSKSAIFKDFTPGVEDDEAITLTMLSDSVNAIRWMEPQSQLLIGTSGGEWRLGGSDIGEPLTPTNASLKRQSTYGSRDGESQLVNDVVLFLQRQGRKVREMTLDPNSVQDKYVAPDLTILAEHITGLGITEIGYQQQPDSILWCVREDGELAAMTYERAQDVVGWHRHITDGAFESISVIPGASEDEIGVIVRREIDGSTVRYIEVFAPRDWGSDQADMYFVDSGLSYDAGDSAVITGATTAAEVVITAVAHGFADGDKVFIDGIVGMTELNGKVYTVSDKTADTFKIKDAAGVNYINAQGDAALFKSIAFWKMNDNAANKDVVDVVGGFDGTTSFNTNTVSQVGKINRAIAVGGNQITVPAASALNFDADPKTMMCWVNRRGSGYLLFGTLGNPFLDGWSVRIDDNEVTWNNLLTLESFSVNVGVPLQEWAHVCVVRDGVNSKIYINGVSVPLLSNTEIGSATSAGDRNFIVAALGIYWLDALMLFDKALSEDQVKFFYNNGNGIENYGFNDYVSGGTAQKVAKVFTGLDHLEGKTCAVLADGGTHPDVVVDGGEVELDYYAKIVHIGLPYNANLVPNRMVFGGQDGSTAARRQRIHEVFVRFYKTLNGKMGRDASHLDPIIFSAFSDLMGEPSPLYTGDKWVQFNGDITNDANLYIRSDTPTPMTVLALMLKMALTE